MISSKTILPEVEKSKEINQYSDLQYSLTLIETSLDYLFMINADPVKDKNSVRKIMHKIISLTCLKDELSKLLYSKEMLKELLKDHERIIIQLRNNFEKFKDREDAKFITSIIEKHQSIARKLRKYF